jgi:polyphosphate kinase 2 (PPK2 family)
MPAVGEVVVFDRSWYNRALVEHVMGFCTDREYKTFLKVCPAFESMMMQNGIILIKYWFEVGMEEQHRRFLRRVNDPMRQWKLSFMDLESHRLWYDYSRARDAMFASTDTPPSPWYVVRSDDKKTARLNCIAHLLKVVPWKKISEPKVKLPKRQNSNGYVEPEREYRFVLEKY